MTKEWVFEDLELDLILAGLFQFINWIHRNLQPVGVVSSSPKSILTMPSPHQPAEATGNFLLLEPVSARGALVLGAYQAAAWPYFLTQLANPYVRLLL